MFIEIGRIFSRPSYNWWQSKYSYLPPWGIFLYSHCINTKKQRRNGPPYVSAFVLKTWLKTQGHLSTVSSPCYRIRGLLSDEMSPRSGSQYQPEHGIRTSSEAQSLQTMAHSSLLHQTRISSLEHQGPRHGHPLETSSCLHLGKRDSDRSWCVLGRVSTEFNTGFQK